MAAISGTIMAATAVAGLGLSAYGMKKQMEGAEQSAAGARLQAQGSGIQAQGSAIQAQGYERQAEGSLRQVEGAKVQNLAQKEITKLEFAAEEQRFKAMEVDARRKQLEIIRNQQRARALGLAGATAQGAGRGSGLQGGYGQISGMTGDNLQGIQQNLEIGRNLFGINAGISGQRLAYAGGGDIINEGQGIIGEGSGIIARGAGVMAQGAGVIAQGGGVSAAGQGITSMGQGLSSLGGSLVQGAQTFGNVGGSIFGSANNNAIKPWNSFFGVNALGR